MAENTTENGSRNTLTGLAKRLSQLPADKRRAALDVSAALAGVSLRVSRDFVEAVPKASRLLSAEDLRLWGELGRKLAMGKAELGSRFFTEGVGALKPLPPTARKLAFQICTRQLVLSSSTALETYSLIPALAAEVADADLLTDILKLALDIANRSARHSSDFIKSTPPVAATLRQFPADADASRVDKQVSDAVVRLAARFANRTGGMAADLWTGIPSALKGLSRENAVLLAEASSEMLEHGGSITLHFISAGGELLRHEGSLFDDWRRILSLMAPQGNAVVIAFLRATPKFFAQMSAVKLNGASNGSVKTEAIRRVFHLVGTIAETDAESALAAFRSSSSALRNISVDHFQKWIESGLEEMSEASAKARRSYFALETRHSNDLLRQTRSGLHLEAVQQVLRLYIEALTGREVEIHPQTAMTQESRIGDGRTIYLPANIAEFDTEEKDFRLYKVLAAYGAGQIEFGTFAKDTAELKAAYAELSDLYSATAEQIDAFSLAGYIEDVQQGEKSSPDADGRGGSPEKKLPKDSDYREVLKLFPEPALARKIFTTMENARIDNMLRQHYRGLRKDLDLMRDLLRERRPFIFDLPMYQVPFELLFQITLCGGATDDARQFYSQIVSEIETVVEKYLVPNRKDAETLRHGDKEIPASPRPGATASLSSVADSLYAASRIYTLFQNITAERSQENAENEQDTESEFAYDDKHADESVTEDKVERETKPESLKDLRELFNAWNLEEEDIDPADPTGTESWSQNEVPEQPLESGDEAFAYDEWDRELNDYRVGWSRVIEKQVRKGDRNFVELARSRYRGVITSIRHQFQMMKPENLTRTKHEIDGEDYDLEALIEMMIDRRTSGPRNENIYIKRLRKQRDVAVSLLLDQSSSTARTITRNPLQPYTYPGRRIIEIEKEGLVLMSEALEAVGDVYSINGFTSEGRRNVKFYVVKDFDEKYSEDIESRIGGITFQNNTRLGAAIRHAAAKLLRQENRTKLLIILTDGRPYDHDYGDARYAREDVREALTEAKISGIIPFCITIDRESEAELRDLYGDVGYTIIDDVLALPERLPNIYRRLTT